MSEYHALQNVLRATDTTCTTCKRKRVMSRTILIGCAFAMTINGAVCAADSPAIQIKAPREWRGETINLPPAFAPDMNLTGVEEIRFAPGMFQAGSDSFFSYVLVFALPEQKTLDGETLNRELLVYYRGLAAAVASARNVEVDVDKFSLELKKTDQDDDGDAPPEWTGTLEWVEPFVTQQPQTLRFDIQTGTLNGGQGMYVTICASPTDRDSDVWKELRSVRKTVTFGKAGE